ncbi:MAG: HAMP domain-containing protein [Chloroflexi bacterium]|nr:HAMP domain-containing protein [Chloroflexota bacterium]
MKRQSVLMKKVWHTLWFRITVAFLVVVVVGVGLVAVLANQATVEGFSTYLFEAETDQWNVLQTQLTQFYETAQSWEGVEGVLVAFQPVRGQGGTNMVLLDAAGETVTIAGGQRNRPATFEDATMQLAIEVNGRLVGTLLIRTPGNQGNQGSRAGEQYLAFVNQAIWLGGAAAVITALLLGIWLARRLTLPLRQLTIASEQLAAGELGQQVEVGNQGEVGDLAISFNQMSVALAAAEQQRQQMLADIAHELRTPLSITRSHIEAMLDGVFEMSPDNLALIHEETLLLGRLVEDLRTLSLAEAGQLSLTLTEMDLAELTKQSVAAFEPLAEAEGVQLTAVFPPQHTPTRITADANRMQQVLGNLISNALRHVTKDNDTPTVIVTLTNSDNAIQLRISDNGQGLSPTAQAHVFDRFWREDSARNREGGGSGLGLAICRAIVEAHNGRISLESIPGEGATFIIDLKNIK